MKRIDRLKRQARQAAGWRGHEPGKFKPDRFWKTVHIAHCNHCPCSVAVDPKPPANGIDICGDAVAINCHDDPH